jgi:TetR/AcrR family transcriptional regulator, transcriptional repressor for nem operon
MKVSKEKTAENRRGIVRAASRLFRERGIEGTGVDSISTAADLTHGAVYSQFGSKEAITVEALRFALAGSRRIWLRQLEKRGRKTALTAIVQGYLSALHRDEPGTGCVIAALGAEISRQARGVRDAFTAELKDALKFLSELLADDENRLDRDDTLALFATMAGALMLSRAVSDRELSDRILTVTTAWIDRAVKAGNHSDSRELALREQSRGRRSTSTT